MKAFTKLYTLATVTLLAGAPLMAQTVWTDNDADGMLNQDEFNTGFTSRNMFGTWDMDGDGMINEDEYNSGMFNTYDRDRSGFIDEDERTTLDADFEAEGRFALDD